MTRSFHHSKLPNHSALLSGRLPTDAVSFQSNALQIWYNNTDQTWIDTPEPLHFHKESDEIFLVLKGALHVEVPVETLMIRAPSVEDKVYKELYA